MNELRPEQIQRMINKAMEVRQNAFAPFSRFNVGASILSADGRIFGGCNVECSSFSLTICAERNALFHAIACGAREFIALAIVGNEIECPPCGACRQALADFNSELQIILADIHGSYRVTSLRTLFPHPFSATQFEHGLDSN